MNDLPTAPDGETGWKTPLKDTYLSLIGAAGADGHTVRRADCVSFFTAQRGSAYEGGLLVVGRAVNSWRVKLRASDLVDAAKRADAVEQSLIEPERPMAWVEEKWTRKEMREDRTRRYNTHRSAFWRVALGVEAALAGRASVTGDASALAWTNLYKVSPCTLRLLS